MSLDKEQESFERLKVLDGGQGEKQVAPGMNGSAADGDQKAGKPRRRADEGRHQREQWGTMERS